MDTCTMRHRCGCRCRLRARVAAFADTNGDCAVRSAADHPRHKRQKGKRAMGKNASAFLSRGGLLLCHHVILRSSCVSFWRRLLRLGSQHDGRGDGLGSFFAGVYATHRDASAPSRLNLASHGGVGHRIAVRVQRAPGCHAFWLHDTGVLLWCRTFHPWTGGFKEGGAA